MDEASKELRVDRSVISVVRLDEQEEEDKRYWRAKTPHERLEALETMRRIAYGYDSTTARLQRVLEVARRA